MKPLSAGYQLGNRLLDALSMHDAEGLAGDVGILAIKA